MQRVRPPIREGSARHALTIEILLLARIFHHHHWSYHHHQRWTALQRKVWWNHFSFHWSQFSQSRSQAARKVLGKLQLRRNLSRPVGLPLPVGHCRSRQSGKRQCELTMVALWPYIVPHCSHCGSVGEGIKGTCASRPIHLNSREGERREGGWVFIPPQPCSIINTNSIIQHLIIFTIFTQLVLICSTYLKLKELLHQPWLLLSCALVRYFNY